MFKYSLVLLQVYIGMLIFLHNVGNPFIWSLCSWVIKIAETSSIFLPILSKAKQTDLNDTPTSMSIEVSLSSR